MYLKNNNRKCVITGVGVIAPNGIGKENFWKNNFNGLSGIETLDFANQYHFKSTIAGSVNHFDPLSFGFNENKMLQLDRYAQFALCAAKMALEDANFSFQTNQSELSGVCIATAICGTKKMEDIFLKLSDQGKKSIDPALANDALFQASTFNMASAHVAHAFQFHGPCFSIPTGCAAGLDAIGLSFDLIRRGDADVMITGASDAPLTPMVMAAFDAIGALSSHFNHQPEKASRPYDALRDGFVLGEACGILILEEKEHALKRHAPILAEIVGYGSTCNAFHMASLPEEGDDLARAIQIALNDAKLDSKKINYIHSHGSATPQNDINETAAYKKIFGNTAYEIPISSLKSMCGHALSGANAIETIAAIGCLIHQKIHPTINLETSDPLCDLHYVPHHSIQHSIQYLLKNASGFSGIHSALILKKV